MRRETQQTTRRTHSTPSSTLIVEVQLRQTQHACWLYGWDRERQRLRATGMQQAHPDLPADLAFLSFADQKEVPVLVLTSESIAPGTCVSVRILGALQVLPTQEADSHAFPLDGWLLLAVPDLSKDAPAFAALEHLPADLLTACRTYLRNQMTSSSAFTSEMACHPASVVELRLREARVWLKRMHHEQTLRRRVSTSQTEEKAVAWRSLEGLTVEQRRLMAQAKTLEEIASFLQAEQLIQFVPLRYQQALSHLLLDDERLLAFLHRPLLQRRTGVFGWQRWRSNEGLLLVTDRQLLWLRDFFSPGSSAISSGYVAHSAPLERLKRVHILPAGSASAPWVDALETHTSPYVRLALEIASQIGSEWFVVELPIAATMEEALARITPLLQAFLPLGPGQQERRVCPLPAVEAWVPRGIEAEQLAALGRIVPEEHKQRLEQRLAERLSATGEEVLVSALVPALAEYQSPARLVALTQHAVLLFDEEMEKTWRPFKRSASGTRAESRYELTHISSAQLSYSLLGSNLRLFVPRSQDCMQDALIPFHGPAIAWFLPLFTRLRLLLGSPISYLPPMVSQAVEKGAFYVNG